MSYCSCEVMARICGEALSQTPNKSLSFEEGSQFYLGSGLSFVEGIQKHTCASSASHCQQPFGTYYIYLGIPSALNLHMIFQVKLSTPYPHALTARKSE